MFIALTNHPEYPTFPVNAYHMRAALTQAQAFMARWMPGYHVWVRPVEPDDSIGAGMVVTGLPFEGFYESRYSQLIDSDEESDIAYYTDEKQTEDGIEEDAKLDSDEIGQIFMKHADYSAGYHAIAKDYVDVFSQVASEDLGFPNREDALGLVFEATDSPKEYNFRTDRVFAYIHPLVLRYLLSRSAVEDNHAKLRERIADKFTSRSGFSSHYDNTLDAWLAKDLDDWDHNELSTLIEAVVGWSEARKRGDDMGWAIFYRIADDSFVYWQACVDWDKVHADIAEAQQEKLAEAHADDPDWEPRPVLLRCDQTPDMFVRAA